MPTIHRFYTPEKLPHRGTVTLPPDESAHAIKVLRLKPGDPLKIMDGQGTVADATVLPPPPNRRIHDAACDIESVTFTPFPTRPIHLYVAPPKGTNMDLLLKEATELGVAQITPVICQYGVARTEKGSKDSWNRNLVAAIKQSANPWLPRLNPTTTFQQALESCPAPGYYGAVPNACHQDKPEDQPPQEGEIALWIGPEGGFTDQEETALKAQGMKPITVGKWILRVETAVAALLACIQFNGQP